MAHILRLSILAIVYLYIVAAKSNDKQPNCQEFSKNVTFKDSQAIGVWHLLHFKTEKTKGSGESHCVEFTNVGEQENKDLQERIGQYVENMNWDKLLIKMQIPCSSVKSNKTRDYYLEKLEGDGSYRTLQMPSPTAKLDLAQFHRYPMRLKLVEGQYLAMMDCHEKFVFLLGKQPPTADLDDRIKKMIDAYWPDEL
ncbi:PREDICTED: uncharacterized protein LOC106107923 [Papilio polytes]|uniref:uncharacterized protein LOC106107923 n=1 Tax=Papilio polytes TaxID=76194 RepID=UPI0006762A9D|nr:PREDICTED: uncharacterized protein LOC106107923 [Papilio polytes]